MKDEHITHIREKEVFLHKKSNNPYHAKQSWVKKDTFQRPKIFQLQECIHWSGGLCLCIELFTVFVNASIKSLLIILSVLENSHKVSLLVLATKEDISLKTSQYCLKSMHPASMQWRKHLSKNFQ